GSLNYLTITRLDISFAFQQCILGTFTRGLFFRSCSPVRLNIFSDSDCARFPDTRYSVSGWLMFLGKSLISRKSKKKDHGFRGLLNEIGFPRSNSCSVHHDNAIVVQIAMNIAPYERTEHINVDCFYKQETVDKGVIILP
uniref:Reverse transcriptase Ty1/copia-type domain-containing protein n=1 Tax=Solanum lycopersicum TaxID=4081 RepID=A0A3Q7ICN8_SOLLC